MHYAASASIPTLSHEKIAARLQYGSWNGHRGSGWEMDIDLDLSANPKKTVYVDISGLTKAGQWFAVRAMDAWSATTGIRFSTETSGHGVQIWMDDQSSGAKTNNTYSSDGRGNYELVSSRINIGQDRTSGDEYDLNSYAFRTFVHELGHALGIGHPADYDGGDTFKIDATFANDSWQTSIMSYYSQSENTIVDATKAYQLTPMVADLIAIQEIYGATGALRAGNTIYGVGSTAGDFYDRLETTWKTMTFTIVDDGGVDTIDFSKTGSDQIVDLRPDSFSSVGDRVGNMAIASGTVIENFRSGSGDDRITGNGAANRLQGGGGDDRLAGAGGGDKLFGDAGSDRLLGESGTDKLYGGGGGDSLLGGAGDDRLEGEAGADKLMGGGGDDKLFGGDHSDVLKGDAGHDTLNGGVGADSLMGGAGKDSLSGGSGNDSLSGGDRSDHLSGGDGDDDLFGNDGNDKVMGDAGDDVLKGGTGADVLKGGWGDDVLRGQDGGDVLDGNKGTDILTGGAGADTFRFAPNGGRDRITDWEDGRDRLDLTEWEIDSFMALKDFATQVSGGLRLELSNKDILIIQGLTMSDLSADDVLLTIA